MAPFKQVVLLVLDGFGVASDSQGNAISRANPRNLHYLINHYPAITLQASGPSVGLPWGEPGNSEVGHLNLGAGRIVSEDLPRISNSIVGGDFFENKAFLGAAKHVKKNKSALHLVGLVSAGGVHSSEEHLYALLGFAKQQGIEEVYIHMFTDGRDTAPKDALISYDRLMRKIVEHGVGRVATVTGRFFAMDRGKHWEVTERTFKAMVLGQGEKAMSGREAIEQNYEKQIYDEMIPPTVMVQEDEPVGTINEGDGVIFFNFRPDRMVQLVESLSDPDFSKFSSEYPNLQNMFYVTMTEYADDLQVRVAYPRQLIKNSLSEVVSNEKMPQFHVAESEKYAHVTSFFSGGHESPWPMEEREIVTSPKTYEKRYEDVPEMSVQKVTKGLIERLEGESRFILANFANADMVGHTGNKKASTEGIKYIDQSLGEIYKAVMKKKACLVVTADHGNAEEMIEPRTGQIDKEHSLNPVPLIIAAPGLERKQPGNKGYLELASKVPDGVLSDVAPTILELMGIKKPAEMTGVSLLSLMVNK